MSVETLHHSALAELRAWQPENPHQSSVRQAALALCELAPGICSRAHRAVHITASALVFSSDGRRVLLTLHPRVGRWIQLGGHCEPADTTVAEAARREAIEESGIRDLRPHPGLAGVAVYAVRCPAPERGCHLDLLFRFTAPADAEPAATFESLALQWWPVRKLPAGVDLPVEPAQMP